jgi:hypothetical protein
MQLELIPGIGECFSDCIATKECSTCRRRLPENCFEVNYLNLKGQPRYSSRCNNCKKNAIDHLKKLKKIHPPPPKGTLCAVPGCVRLGTCLDHDHNSGRARGYICGPHNSAFAYCNDSVGGVQALLEYAQQWEAKGSG